MHPLRNVRISEALSWWGSFLKVFNVVKSTAKATVEETAKLAENDALKTGIGKNLQLVKSDEVFKLGGEF